MSRRRQQRKRHKKAIGLDWQINNSALHVHHAFLYISLPPVHDYEVNCQIFTFHRHREHTTTNFSFSPQTWDSFLRIQLQESLPTLNKVSELG